MIRDRIFVDIKLSERLQLDPKLTLEIAVTSARQAESVHQQQSLLHGEEMKQSPSIGSIKSQKKVDHPKGKPTQGGHNNGRTAGVTCSRCGKSSSHDAKSCPAKDAICRKCRK